MTIREAVRQGAAALRGGSATPALDSELLMAHTLQKTRSYVIAHGQDALSEDEAAVFLRCIQQRREGTPVAYITGMKEFYGFDFVVTRDTLIPKPDTELLVELAAEAAAGRTAPVRMADICCGTGCVGISVALKAKVASAAFADVSPKALDVARRNAARLLQSGMEAQTEFLCGDLMGVFSPKRQFDLILSNPPYIRSGEVAALLSDGRGEPPVALDGGEDGLDITRRLVKEAAEHLAPAGCLVVESSEEGAGEAAEMMRAAGLCNVTEHNDMTGQPRAARGVKPLYGIFSPI